jgi:DNA-binding beta-propeller fold protein YncE
MRVNLRLALLAPIALLLLGCAGPKYLMRLDTEPRTDAVAQVWPPAPEVPRYRYVGQLKGDDNFVLAEDSPKFDGRKFLYWLVGLVGMGEDKVVLKRPQSGMVDATGRILVTDAGRVLVFDQAAGKLDVWDRAEANKPFVSPVGITAGAKDEILVADSGLAGVYRLSRDGKPLGRFSEGMQRPTGLAHDPKRGLVYVADTAARVVKVFQDTGDELLLQTLGQREGIDTDENGRLNSPTHITLAQDRLYVTDSLNARVQIYDAQGMPAGNLGQRGLYVGNLVRPKGVAVDGDGNLYVIESYYDYLLIYNRQGEFLMPLGGSGQALGKFNLPAGVWSDRQGRIYVADMFNGRVAIFQFLGGPVVKK